MTQGKSTRVIGIVCVFLGLSLNAFAAKETDVVELKVGSKMIGEIVSLGQGYLQFKTNQMGTLRIEWNKVANITSPRDFEVELTTGQKYFGSLGKTEDSGFLSIKTAQGSAVFDLLNVVFITPIESKFWKRTNGGLDLGFSYTKSNQTVQYTLGFNADYKSQSFLANFDASSFFSNRRDSEKSSRTSLGLYISRLLPKRWFVTGLSNVNQSSELGLDLRVMLGATAGRQLIQSNFMLLLVSAGVVATQEYPRGQDVRQTSAEGLLIALYRLFKFEKPETELNTSLEVYPGLTNWGRVRLEFDGRFQIAVFKDFYWSIRYYYSFDSDPSAAANARDDYGLTTSIGWSW